MPRDDNDNGRRHHTPRSPPTPGPRRLNATSTATTTNSTTNSLIEFQQGLGRALKLQEQLVAATAAAAKQQPKSKQQQQQQQQQQQDNHKITKQTRFSLCEVLSHLILLNPALAVSERLPDRLWTHCFYERCKAATTTIAAAASKRKKQQEQACTSTTKSSSKASAAMIITPEWEASWKAFLSQSITLYAYLVDALQDQLAKGLQRQQTRHHQQQQSNTSMSANGQQQQRDDDDSMTVTSTQETINDFDDDPDKENGRHSTTPATTQGIVPCLARLLIHLGDLYRYSTTNAVLAEQSYQQAAALAPGYGNAYNQLAVLKHQHNSDHYYCVAFYYYLRALAATIDSFGPAAGNLRRLFKDNSKVLAQMIMVEQEAEEAQQQQQQNTSVQILAKPSQNKSLLSKRFLTEFVDFHWTVAEAASMSLDALQQQQHGDLENRAERLTGLFTALLQQSVFGEGLLIKIVCIQAQAEYAAERQLPNEIAAIVVPVIRGATMQLANALAEKVLAGIQKQLGQQLQLQQQKGSSSASSVSLSSVKLLLPLMLWTEYLYHAQQQQPAQRHKQENDNMISSDDMDQCSEEFWMKTIDIMNALKDLASMLELPVDSRVNSELKQYQAMRGFEPFQSFMDELSNGYISDREAMDVLHLCEEGAATPASQVSLLTNASRTTDNPAATQESTGVQSSSSVRSSTTAGGSAQSWDEALAKVARYLKLGDDFVKDSHSQVGKRIERSVLNDKLTWTVVERAVDDMPEDDVVRMVDEEDDAAIAMDDDKHTNTTIDDDEDEAGDVITDPPALVYKSDVTGGLPLLVPGALLEQQSKAGDTSPAEKSNTRTNVLLGNDDPMNMEHATSVPLPKESLLQSTLEHILKGSPSLPNPTALPPPPGMSPPPGFGSTSTCRTRELEAFHMRPPEVQQPVDLAFPTAGQRQPMYMFESPLLFGSPSSYVTVNPFAATVDIPAAPSGNLNHPPMSDFIVDNMFANDDGSAFLGSGLLSSILNDDSPQKTKNPFV